VSKCSALSRYGCQASGRDSRVTRWWHTPPVSLREWLYGPIVSRATEGVHGGTLVVAPLTLDTDALREFYLELSKERQVQILASSGYGGTEATVDDVAALLDLPLFDRRNITFRSSNYVQYQTGFLVALSTFTQGTVYYPPDSEEVAIVDRAFLALDGMANRRLRVSRVRDVVRCLAVLLLAGFFAWSCAAVANARNWPAFVLIGLALVPVVLLIDGWLRRRFQRISERTHVTRILEMSRSQQQQERWNKKLNFKWSLVGAAVTTPITVVVTAVVTLAIGK
jgi:hypothetical protein